MYLEFWIFKNLSHTKGMVLGLNMWKNTAVLVRVKCQYSLAFFSIEKQA